MAECFAAWACHNYRMARIWIEPYERYVGSDAAKAEPRWPEPYLHLALLAVRSNNQTEVADVTDRVLQLDSFDYPQAFFFNAVANYNLKHAEAAEKSARSAEKLDTRHHFPQIARLLGTILAERHRYAEAADEFRNYLMLAPRAADAPAGAEAVG